MAAIIDIKPGETEIFRKPRAKRYYLIAGVIALFSIVGLAIFLVTWSSHFPAFLLNYHTTVLMNLSGIILLLVIILIIIINVRESRGHIVLTSKRLIIPSTKKPYFIEIPFTKIKEWSLGRSPLETISGCGSIWIVLNGESYEDCLAGPLPWEQAEFLYQLINKEKGLTN